MSHAELVLRPDSAHAGADGVDLAIRLPHYRSLPLSCLMGLRVSIDGNDVDAEHLPLTICGKEYRVAELGSKFDTEWYLQDPAVLHTDIPKTAGEMIDVSVAIKIRIPYVIIEPFGPLERVIESSRSLTIE
ncbi:MULTISPECIES: DUF6379 domain-containing protein [unclassified Arthrobacter]|uniref:C-glycoside deglycosidase beta subunit domain-containing protein n=1 Tax=unclassified Arthrobacter TaxID=235627 RepID=UPI001C84A493|nr:DUF6379 domain-containing protein [Arthrobacter sp. MAHUQ-56]MBX7445930.1 hypothetical protein [Arthrobacter sp. MAHUQ-56]